MNEIANLKEKAFLRAQTSDSMDPNDLSGIHKGSESVVTSYR
jgi:hypothetical protein